MELIPKEPRISPEVSSHQPAPVPVEIRLRQSASLRRNPEAHVCDEEVFIMEPDNSENDPSFYTEVVVEMDTLKWI